MAGGKFAVHQVVRIAFPRGLTHPQLEFFSLGGLLSVIWDPPIHLAPWIIASVALGLCACWDVFRGAGRVDFILLGLAAYELVIGLTEGFEESAQSSYPPAGETASS